MSLLEKLSDVFTTRRAAAAKTYREIIARADRPKANDADQLAAAMADLGIGQPHFAADLAALREERRVAGSIPSDVSLAQQLQQADDADQNRRRELVKAREQRVIALNAFRAALATEQELTTLIRSAPELTAAAIAKTEAQALTDRIKALRTSHPLAFSES